MLIALLTILFLGGGTTSVMSFLDDTGDSIKTVVVDDERRKEAFATVKLMEKRSKGHEKSFRRLIKDLKKKLRDHSHDESVFDAMWDQHYELANEYSADMVDLRFELKDQLTREEWAQVFGGQ